MFIFRRHVRLYSCPPSSDQKEPSNWMWKLPTPLKPLRQRSKLRRALPQTGSTSSITTSSSKSHFAASNLASSHLWLKPFCPPDGVSNESLDHGVGRDGAGRATTTSRVAGGAVKFDAAGGGSWGPLGPQRGPPGAPEGAPWGSGEPLWGPWGPQGNPGPPPRCGAASNLTGPGKPHHPQRQALDNCTFMACRV